MRAAFKFGLVLILMLILLPRRAAISQAAAVERPQCGNTHTVYIEDDISQVPKIISAPLPVYTKGARRKKIEGVVLLKVLLHSSGKVTKIIPLKELPYGLTENSMAAARKIKFRVGRINGKAVSVYQEVGYTFSTSKGVVLNY